MRFNEIEIANKLSAKGYHELQIDDIMEVFNSLPIVIDVKSGKISAGDYFEIEFLNSSYEKANISDILTTDKAKIKIDGIDQKRIKSLSLPKIDFSEAEIMSIEVEYFPFTLPEFDWSKLKF